MKQEFTNAGLQLLLLQLFSLPDAQLQEEAEAVNDDFSEWLKANFFFSSEQEDFLDAMNPDFLADAASQSSYFIANRLPITLLVYPAPVDANSRAKDRGKLVNLQQQSVSSYSPTLGTGRFQSLVFSISYLDNH